MHEDLIASGRRHVVVVAALGIALLALALAIIFFPFALGVGALGTALGGTWGYGWKLIGLSFGMAFLFALAIVLVGFVWMFRHAEPRAADPDAHVPPAVLGPDHESAAAGRAGRRAQARA